MTKRKCEAVNAEGKPCHFSGSTQVDGRWLCGNHAMQAKKLLKEGKSKEIIPIIPKVTDPALAVAEAIHKLYESGLGSTEVIASILRNVWG